MIESSNTHSFSSREADEIKMNANDAQVKILIFRTKVQRTSFCIQDIPFGTTYPRHLEPQSPLLPNLMGLLLLNISAPRGETNCWLEGITDASEQSKYVVQSSYSTPRLSSTDCSSPCTTSCWCFTQVLFNHVLTVFILFSFVHTMTISTF